MSQSTNKVPKKELSYLRYLQHLGYEVTYVRNFTDVDDKILLQLKEKALTRAGLVEDDVIRLINERVEVRRNKDFLKSDQMRADLQAKGIALMDVGTETIWRPCVPVQQEPEVVPLGDQKVPSSR
ncbi:hypothetical protein V6N13_069378 [Hibiscus sabdariffa]